MQTRLQSDFLKTTEGTEANQILRACVHCGFCTATCPTYQLLGDELDGPRGRIYLIKQVLEGQGVSHKTRDHLDRCLSCRACETTCPSGVQYGRLLDIGREVVENRVPRKVSETIQRLLLRKFVAYPVRFQAVLKFANLIRPLLSDSIKHKIPVCQSQGNWPQPSVTQKHKRRMLVLAGCAQKAVTPDTNATTARVLNKLGIELIEASKAGCCGALSHHLSAVNDSHQFIKRNIDAWWPYIEQGIEAIIITASGCGVMVKDYGHLLEHDLHYADKARRVSELARDISEIIAQESLPLKSDNISQRVAFHSPCTLQHGQQLNGVVEQILDKAGFTLCQIKDSHLCCGSAGSYSIFQPKISEQLKQNKLAALRNDKPDIIATANIGCQMHLSSNSDTPVVHWIDLLESRLRAD